MQVLPSGKISTCLIKNPTSESQYKKKSRRKRSVFLSVLYVCMGTYVA